MTCTDPADRTRALILLRATLETVAGRLDDDSIDDLGLLVRISELEVLVNEELHRLAPQHKTGA